MAFASWHDVIAMGGYGFFVWLSYGLSFLVLAGLLVQGLWQRRQIQRACVQQQARQQRLARRQQQERSR